MRQPGFTYSACGPFTKNKERIQSKLDKACLQHDMAYEDFKDLSRKQLLIKYCWVKHLVLLKIQNMDMKGVLHQWLINDSIKSPLCFKGKSASGGAVKSEVMLNQEWAQELHKPIVRKNEKRKVYSSFIANIWGADLVNMQLISKFNKELSFLFCFIDIFGKYAWVI